MPAKATKGERGRVQYHLQKVNELPVDEVARGMKYFHLLRPLMDDPGSLYLIATFSTDSGAGTVKKELDEGGRTIPPGKWEFDTRRITEDEKRVSKLYARYIGPEA